MLKSIMLWSARNQIKKFIKSGIVSKYYEDQITFRENSKESIMTIAQYANSLLRNTKGSDNAGRMGIKVSDIANIIREELQKGQTKKEVPKQGIADKLIGAYFNAQKSENITMAKYNIRRLIKGKRLEYLKDGQVSYQERNGKIILGSVEKLASILIDKTGREQMTLVGIFEDEMAEIIRNRGK